ncbi:MAG: hypothetical protein LBT11_02680 [Treponema sp.]|nr:hypothetical protein [Treponema sp.]
MAAGYRIAAALVVLSVLMLIPIPGKPEPSAAGETNMAPYIPNMKEIVKVTLGFFKSNGAGQWALILPMGIGFIAVSGIDNLWQPLFLEKQNEHLVWILGYAWVFIRLGTLAAGIIARSLRTRVNTQKYFGLALLGSAVFVSLSAWLQLWWLSAFTFALHASAWVLFSVLTDGYLYKAIPGESKATTLSTLSSFYSVTGIMGMLTLSLLADYSIALAFFAASAVFILAFFSAGFLRKKVH